MRFIHTASFALIMALSPLPAQTTPPAAPNQSTAPQTLPAAPQASTPDLYDALASARQKIATGAFPSAERELTALMAGRPASADTLYLIGYVLFREGRYTESLKRYTEAAALRQPTPDDLLVVASDYIALADYADAGRWLAYVTGHVPTNATAWYLLGRTEYLQDHAAEALASFERCLQLRPRDTRAKYNQGLALERLQRPDEALTAYRTAVQWTEANGTRDPQPYLNLGTLLLAQGKTGESIAALQHAADLGPRNPMCFQQLGRALEAAAQNEKAVTAYRHAIELAPGAERPHFFLGRLLRKLGRTEQADAEFAAVAHLYGGKSNTETPNPDSPR